MNFAIGNEIEVKAADFGVRHSGRVVGIDSWDAIQIPPATEAMNKGMRIGEQAGADWTNLYQDKEKAFNPPPKNVKAEKAIKYCATGQHDMECTPLADGLLCGRKIARNVACSSSAVVL